MPETGRRRLSFSTTAEEADRRLDRILADRVPDTSRFRIRRWLDAGWVTVAGTPRPAGHRPAAFEVVEVDAPDEGPSAMTPEPMRLDIVYRDASLLVVNKPAGLVVHPTGGHRTGTLVNGLCHLLNVEQVAAPPIRPGIAHRLDRDTTGLLVVALTQAALSFLTLAFHRRQVVRRYLAVVRGTPVDPQGAWEAPIGPRADRHPRWGIDPAGRPALTRYRTVLSRGELSLLELEPVTGRTGQLRIHAAHFGHPIAGDALFGPDPPGAGPLLLHAWRLAFTHPEDGRRLEFTRPPGHWMSHLPGWDDVSFPDVLAGEEP